MKPNLKDGDAFSKQLFTVKMRTIDRKKEKQVYLGLFALNLSQKILYEFHYNDMQTKYLSKVKPYYMFTEDVSYQFKG